MNDAFEPEDSGSMDEDAELDSLDGEDGDDGENGEGEDGESDSRHAIPTTPPSLEQSIERLDALLEEAEEEEKIKAAMGIRLALGMAQELKQGKSLGSETTDMVAEWVRNYGQEVVEAAVHVARGFLLKPAEMRRVMGERLGMGNPE